MVSFFNKVLHAIGFKKLIRLRGVSFDNLTEAQVAMMIEAFLSNGNEAFDVNALDEFESVSLANPKLKAIQQRLLQINEEFSTGYSPDGLSTKAGREALRELAAGLRSGIAVTAESR